MAPSTTASSAAIEAHRLGWVPVPIVGKQKRPALPAWQHQEYTDEAAVEETFKAAQQAHDDPIGIGLVLGEPSGGLVDVDLDHPKALRLKDLFLPHTDMVSGRATTRRSHHWYICTDDLPGSTKRYSMPDGTVSVELRTTGGQTVIPPSIHPSGEPYIWESDPWGGEEGPARVQGRLLGVRVATLAMGCVLVDGWPTRGGRHDAYLALAGGLLRYGADDEGGATHPLWEKALPGLIKTLAVATDDEDGPEARAAEVMGSTMERLRVGGKVQGFPTLARLIGGDHADLIRRYARDIESLSGHAVRPEKAPDDVPLTEGPDENEDPGEKALRLSLLPMSERDPLEERDCTWEPVDLLPYIDGEVIAPVPTILRRTDGLGLFYPGKVNFLYGASETGKSWITFAACKEQIEDGEHVMFVDCEDDPDTAVLRMKALGCADDDLRQRFTYIHPEGPLGALSRNSYGEPNPSEEGKRNFRAFMSAIEQVDPSLIVLDGLTVLYGLHGLSTNDASNTEVIGGFWKGLTNGGKRAVIIIDHTSKGATRGATPIGSQHKISMTQGAAIQVYAITKPRPGYVGQIELLVGKDRPGVVRGASMGNDPHVAADVKMDATTAGRMILSVEAPQEAVVIASDERSSHRLSELADDCDAILAVLMRDGGAMRKAEILLALPKPMKDHRAKRALKTMTDDGRISLEGERKSARYRVRETL